MIWFQQISILAKHFIWMHHLVSSSSCPHVSYYHSCTHISILGLMYSYWYHLLYIPSSCPHLIWFQLISILAKVLILGRIDLQGEDILYFELTSSLIWFHQISILAKDLIMYHHSCTHHHVWMHQDYQHRYEVDSTYMHEVEVH